MPLPKRRSWNQIQYTNYLLIHQKQLGWIFWCYFDVCASGGNHYKSAMKLRYEPFSFTTSEFYNIFLISLIEWIHIKNSRTQKTVATCFCHRNLKIQKLRQVIAQFTCNYLHLPSLPSRPKDVKVMKSFTSLGSAIWWTCSRMI